MEQAIDNDAGAPDAARVPWHFWLIAVVGLLWNCIGVYFYIQARLDPDAVMAGASGEMRDYVANMPLWANVGYGFGIWGSFAGSVLMVLRSRHAVSAFWVSLVGAIVSFAGQAAAGVLRPVEPIVILAVIALLLWYSYRAAARNYLR
jgi:hypothetical protein